MEYTSEFNISLGVCVIKVAGVHRRPEDSHELLRVASTFAAEHGCGRFLFDMREATIVGDTMGALYTALDPERLGFDRLHRVASVYRRITENEKFMENIGVNRGALYFRIFDDIEKAREWVASQ